MRRAPAPAPREAPPPQIAQPPATATIGPPPPAYAGGQVGRGGQVGVLGNLDYMSTPFSTQSFTKEFIENRQLRSLYDVLLSDPSISSAASPATPITDYMKFRGFTNYAAGDQSALNGLVGINTFWGPPVEILERVELIKGANSFLNGAVGAVGGSVNYVTKHATAAPVTTLTSRFISDGIVGGHFDYGRRYGERQEFGVRANGFIRDGDNVLRGTSRKDGGGSLALDYRTDRLRIDVDLYQYEQKLRGYNYYVTLAPGLSLPAAPDPKTLLQPPWMTYYQQSQVATVRAEYDIAQDWTVSGGYGAAHSSNYYTGYCVSTILNLSGAATCASPPSKGIDNREAASLALRGQFYTGPIKHRVAFGGNYIEEEFRSQPGLVTNSVFAYNIYNPVFPAEAPAGLGDTRRSYLALTRGAFISDTLSLFDDRFALTLGVRRTAIELGSFNTNSGAQTTQLVNKATTPAVAALVKINPVLSLYGNYIEALERGAIATAPAVNAGQVFPALVSTQKEGGLKADFGSIGGTLAVYQIAKANQYRDTTTNAFTQDGLQENTGVEISVFGEPIKGLRFVAGAAAIDGRLKRTAGGLFDGKQAPGVPEYELRLQGEADVWTIPGLTLTAAVQHAGPAPYDNANSLDVPAWTKLDLGTRYTWWADATKMTARFTVENVTGEAYWISGYASALSLSAPRTYLLSLTADFTPADGKPTKLAVAGR